MSTETLEHRELEIENEARERDWERLKLVGMMAATLIASTGYEKARSVLTACDLLEACEAELARRSGK